MIDFCKRLGIEWGDGDNTSEVFYLKSRTNPRINGVPFVADKLGDIMTAHSHVKVGLTVLDILNKEVEIDTPSKVESIKCKIGDEYSSVDFDDEDNPSVFVYTFDGDIFDYYNMHSGNMFPPRCRISKQLAMKIAKAIVTCGTAKSVIDELIKTN